MSPIVLLGLGGLALFALTATAKAASETSTAKLSSKPKGVSKSMQLRTNARKFLKYVNGGGSNKSTIKRFQGLIGASKTGIADGQSEKRIESILGYDVTWKPKRKIVKPKAYPTGVKKTKVRKAPVKVKPETDPLSAILASLAGKKPATKPKLEPKPKPKVKPKAAARPATRTVKALPASTQKMPPSPKLPPVPTVPDSVLAADSLNKYLLSGGLDRNKVKSYQRRMGGLAVDGVAGPKTLARAESLLQRDLSWPHIVAALSLRKYYKVDRGRNRDVVKGYQEKMGELTVDGLVGPKTKARYRSLTGKKW